MIKGIVETTLEHRGDDKWGSGHFGASRGSRTHNGIDYKCSNKTAILSPVTGTVTKLGYPYKDDLSYRYVEVTDCGGLKHRVFYVDPMVSDGDEINSGDVIGVSQNLEVRYTDITPHIHYEIKTQDGKYLDPEKSDGN